ncbi:hypothetical protein [Azospirillum largimobile]
MGAAIGFLLRSFIRRSPAFRWNGGIAAVNGLEGEGGRGWVGMGSGW